MGANEGQRRGIRTNTLVAVAVVAAVLTPSTSHRHKIVRGYPLAEVVVRSVSTPPPARLQHMGLTISHYLSINDKIMITKRKQQCYTSLG